MKEYFLFKKKPNKFSKDIYLLYIQSAHKSINSLLNILILFRTGLLFTS